MCIQCLSAAGIFSVLAWPEGRVLPVLAPGFVGCILWLVAAATLGS